MVKQKTTTKEHQPTINYENNLLTFAERKFFEMLDGDKYREVSDDYEFQNVVVNKCGRKIKSEQRFNEKISRVKNEVKEVSKVADGDYRGVIIIYKVIKKGFQKWSTINHTVVFVGDELYSS
jgi:hypothetical protein